MCTKHDVCFPSPVLMHIFNLCIKNPVSEYTKNKNKNVQFFCLVEVENFVYRFTLNVTQVSMREKTMLEMKTLDLPGLMRIL